MMIVIRELNIAKFFTDKRLEIDIIIEITDYSLFSFKRNPM